MAKDAVAPASWRDRPPQFALSLAGQRRLGRRAWGSGMGMLAILAAIVFGIGFVINATGRATDRAFSVTGLLLLGLTLLALHQAGIGSVWVRRR
jgi:hypothetical protein